MNLRLIRQVSVVAVAGLVASALTAAAAAAAPGQAARPGSSGMARFEITGGATSTPIKHVVVIIGENHTFDNVFATYQPPRRQHIENLLSEGIVTRNGTPGPNYASGHRRGAEQPGAMAEHGHLRHLRRGRRLLRLGLHSAGQLLR